MRKEFLMKYSIIRLNIFEERVFDDTSCTVCSLLFKQTINVPIEINIYPSRKKLSIVLNNSNNYSIGGEIYKLPINPEYKIERATRETNNNLTNILLKCVDDSVNSQLGFKIVEDKDRFIDNTPKLSARSYATLVINKSLTLPEQKILVEKMNLFIQEKGDKYNSLFLSNYRDSNTIARKRISFGLAFIICNYILTTM